MGVTDSPMGTRPGHLPIQGQIIIPPGTLQHPGHNGQQAGCTHPTGMLFTGRNEVLAKVIFLHLSVIHSVHGGYLTTPTWHPPSRKYIPPPEAADSGIRSTLGRYASYWNEQYFSRIAPDRRRTKIPLGYAN